MNSSDFEISQKNSLKDGLIEKAIDAGVNYFDATHVEEAESLGLGDGLSNLASLL